MSVVQAVASLSLGASGISSTLDAALKVGMPELNVSWLLVHFFGSFQMPYTCKH